MPPVKISVITVCYNAAATIRRCINSVISQDYPHIEFIIIDGASTDGTAQIAAEYGQVTKLVSEPDRGIYDAMNKGIAHATGNIIGFLNADDYFVDDHIISKVAQAFGLSSARIVYGDINIVNRADKIIRRWVAGAYKGGAFNRGWMPPHPAFYAQRELFGELGGFKLDYGSAADYELMLRFMHNNGVKAYYLNSIFLHMKIGGVSNKNVMNRVKAYRYDLKAMRNNGIAFPYLALVMKPLRKIHQYFF